MCCFAAVCVSPLLLCPLGPAFVAHTADLESDGLASRNRAVISTHRSSDVPGSMITVHCPVRNLNLRERSIGLWCLSASVTDCCALLRRLRTVGFISGSILQLFVLNIILFCRWEFMLLKAMLCVIKLYKLIFIRQN